MEPLLTRATVTSKRVVSDRRIADAWSCPDGTPEALLLAPWEVAESQIVRYSVGGLYAWHRDVLRGGRRKTTVVGLLSDPSEFTGGVLELRDGRVWHPRARGDVFAFPASLEHRVTAVLAGVRWIVVGWSL